MPRWALFVHLGYQAAKTPGGRVAIATDFGIPVEYAETAVRANGAAMVLGGLSVATGVLPRLGALAVAGAMVPTTLAGALVLEGHRPQDQGANLTQFLKNLGLVGGLLAVASELRGSSACCEGSSTEA